MPTVYSLSCTDCDNTKLFGFLQVPYIVLDDGQRKNLSHPGEDRAAKHQTGFSLRQLRKLDRVGRRNAYACKRCLQLQLFADDEILETCPECAHSQFLCLGTLIGQSRSSLQCAKCKTGTLVLETIGRS